jgi:membrane protein DedA with SNARE-associated domain
MNDMTQFLMGYGGPVLFAIVFAEQAGLPLPSAPWLLAAGALSANGKLSPALAVGVTALAAIMADSLWFYVGRRGGQRVLRLFCRLSLSRNACVGRTKGLFARHGFQALLAAKFLPGLGTVMPPLAGALGMTISRFLLFDAVGSLFYGSFYIAAGFLFHNQLKQAMALLNRLGFGALLLGALVVSGYIAFKFARRRNLVGGSPQHNPANKKAGISVGGSGLLAGGAYSDATSLPAESLGALRLQNAALAVTGSPPEGVGEHPTAQMVPCSL